MLRSRPHRGVATRAGRCRLEKTLRRRRPLVSHRRDLRSTFRNNATRRARSDGSCAEERRDRLLRSELSPFAVEGNRRSGNRELVRLTDVLFGNEEDFSVALGFEVEGVDEHHSALPAESFKRMIGKVCSEFGQLQAVATTLRVARSATRNDWGAMAWSDGKFYEAVSRPDLEILDRVGGGDSFASGFIYGHLTGRGPAWAVECGAAHGALAMTTPGDASMATQAEVERVMKG